MTPETMIDQLFKQKICWLSGSDREDAVAVSSRIRFARNLQGREFPMRSGDQDLCEIRDEILDAAKQIAKHNRTRSFLVFQPDELSVLDRQFLLERHLISREMQNPRHGSALLTNCEQNISIMVNEEDHLRIQVFASGFQLKKLYDRINVLDEQLASNLYYAFRQDLGYLTACPSNLGTAMRASVMLHLPGLVLSEQIAPVLQGVSKLGLTARGLFGEGSKNQGDLFQISNQSSLGETENEILTRLEKIVSRIIEHEKKARSILSGARQEFMLNHVSRAYGLLQHSYMITGEEALNALSAVRLGEKLKMIRSISAKELNELFMLVQSAHLQKYTGREMESCERDTVRAALLRPYFMSGKG